MLAFLCRDAHFPAIGQPVAARNGESADDQ
jgi:hypothetical protein